MLVFLNGQLLPRDSAFIPVDDRGFRFGDGVFETMAIIYGQPYLWQEHLARLEQGLALLSIPVQTDGLVLQLLELIRQNHIRHGIARIIISRGSGSRGYLPVGETCPTIYLEVIAETPSLANPADKPRPPISLWQSKWRRFPSTSLPNEAKIMQGMHATLARLEARQHGCDEALVLSVEEDICEAASGNLFWVKGSILYTPALSTGCLAGVMRKRLMQLWPDGCREVNVPVFAFADMDALVMTNSVHGAVPIHSIDNLKLDFPKSSMLARRCNLLIADDIAKDITRFHEKNIAFKEQTSLS